MGPPSPKGKHRGEKTDEYSGNRAAAAAAGGLGEGGGGEYDDCPDEYGEGGSEDESFSTMRYGAECDEGDDMADDGYR